MPVNSSKQSIDCFGIEKLRSLLLLSTPPPPITAAVTTKLCTKSQNPPQKTKKKKACHPAQTSVLKSVLLRASQLTQQCYKVTSGCVQGQVSKKIKHPDDVFINNHLDLGRKPEYIVLFGRERGLIPRNKKLEMEC